MKDFIHYQSKFFLLLLLYGSALSLASCENNESSNQGLSSEELKIRIDNIVSEMKLIGNQRSKIVKYKLENLKKDDYLSFINIIENSAKVTAFMNGFKSQNRGPGDDYTVTCTYGDGEVVITECGENTGCAGQATWDCLEGGGCAGICNNKAELSFTPATIN